MIILPRGANIAKAGPARMGRVYCVETTKRDGHDRDVAYPLDSAPRAPRCDHCTPNRHPNKSYFH